MSYAGFLHRSFLDFMKPILWMRSRPKFSSFDQCWNNGVLKLHPCDLRREIVLKDAFQLAEHFHQFMKVAENSCPRCGIAKKAYKKVVGIMDSDYGYKMCKKKDFQRLYAISVRIFGGLSSEAEKAAYMIRAFHDKQKWFKKAYLCFGAV